MEIPDQSVGWGVGVLGAIVAWLVRLEARLNARPTRQEQEEIAARVAANIKDQFTEIKGLLEKQNESASLNRQLMADSLAEVRTNVAVLRAHVGEDSLVNPTQNRRRV